VNQKRQLICRYSQSNSLSSSQLSSQFVFSHKQVSVRLSTGLDPPFHCVCVCVFECVCVCLCVCVCVLCSVCPLNQAGEGIGKTGIYE
jgi:hypothetical protein